MVDNKIVEEIVIKADGSQAKREAESVEAKFGKMFTKAALEAAAFNQALGLAGKAVGFLAGEFKKGIDAALEYERTTIAQRAALDAAGLSADAFASVLLKQAAELERVSGISDEVIRKYQTMAINLGATVGGADELVRASMALSQVTGRDVRESMNQLIKTQTGLLEETMRTIPGIRNLTKEQLQSGDAIRVVNEQYGKFIDLQTRGGAGQIQKFATSWSNFAEAVGKGATSLSQMSGAFESISGWLDKITTILEKGTLRDFFLVELSGAVDIISRLPGFGAAGNAARLYMSSVTQSRADALNSEAVNGSPFTGAPWADNGQIFREKQKAAVSKKGGSQSGGSQVDRLGGISPEASALIAADEEMQRIRQDLAEEELQKRLAWEVERANKISDIRLSLEQRLEDGLAAIAQNNAERRMELQAREADYRQAQAEIAESQAADTADAISNAYRSGFGLVLRTGIGTFEALVDGADVSAEAIASSMLKGIGAELMGRGASDILEGGARLIRSYGADQTGTALLAQGGLEIGAGAALYAGGAAAASSVAGVGSSGGVSGGGGASGFDFATRGGIPGRRFGADGGGEKTITIHVSGLLSPAETGVAVKRALDAAQHEGRI